LASKSRKRLRGCAGWRAAAVLGVVVLALCSPAQAASTRTGTLHATVTDNFRTGQSTTRYTLESGKQKAVVRPTELAAEPGDRVVVTGGVRDGRLVGAVESVTADPQAAVAAGPRKVAVLLVSFPGESSEPWSLGQARSQVFTGANSANAFYREESYDGISLTGKLRADGDVFGWFRLNGPTAGCPDGVWKEEADEAAAAAGVDLSGYQHVVYMFPFQIGCSWLGTSALGGSWAMINGTFSLQVIAHELGHNLGLFHAGSWTCTSGGVRVQISDTCTASEYGDPFDAMGNIAYRHNNGWSLAKLGFLGADNVETIDTSGTYSMRSALHFTVEPTVLRIPRTRAANGAITSWYYLEVREKGGVFENVTDSSTTGVSIRATAGGMSPETLLLDANPTTATFQDAPLKVGQTFDGGPVRITTLSAGGGSASVSVELDEEPPTAPTGLTAIFAGADGVQLQWSASSDNFGVDRYLVFRDGTQIGTSTGTSLLDSLAAVGDHEYVVYAEDSSENRSVASEPAMVTVEADEESPTAPTDLTAAVEFEGVQLQWSASSDNFGVDHYVVLRDGTQVATPGSTGFLDSLVPAGAHEYVVYATDAAGSRSTASGPATATVPEVAGPACAAGTCRVTYRHSGAPATWIVPPGVAKADFIVEGARGGSDRSGDLFGRGARVESTLGSLMVDEGVAVSVGGAGKTDVEGGAGGFNGGGNGTLGGGGGGFSSVTLGSTLMLLAGGGGGKGSKGFNSIAETEPGGGSGGRGGEVGTAGSGGVATEALGAILGRGNGGAAGGNGGAGGAGGAVTGATTCPGGAGAGAVGASGGSLTGGGGVPAAGGGGGGGYVGGGQGGGSAGDACENEAGSGGGGGGSSFAAPGLSATFTGGFWSGDGQVSIAYANPIAAANRNYTTAPDQELTVAAASGVLSGASGPSGVPLSPSVVGPPTHGSVTLGDDGTFTYEPTSGYAGDDSFVYRVTDPSGNYAIAQAILTVASSPSASNSTPAGDGTYSLGQVVPTTFACGEGVGGPGLLSCNDSSGAKAQSGGVGHLDTSTAGPHVYAVTATSKDGLTGSASIDYTVVPAPRPPDGSGDPPHDPNPPDGPERPPHKIKLSLGVEGEPPADLLRAGKLVVAISVNVPARVTLAGSAELRVHAARRGIRTRSVAVLERTTVGFEGADEKRVALVLSRRGREALRHLPKLRLAIAAKATDAAGRAARRTVTLTLRR
jgi:hypothetical protein